MVDAEPVPIAIDPDATALLIIHMHRDFLEPGGFGETLGNDVTLLAAAVGPCQVLLASARRLGMLVVHTREEHRPDLSDAPRAKIERGSPHLRIGAQGPMSRILIRGGLAMIKALGGIFGLVSDSRRLLAALGG
jgi:biuret amidohydrolase